MLKPSNIINNVDSHSAVRRIICHYV